MLAHVRLQDLAGTPMDSQVRFEARRLLPGMAARLRVVGQVPHIPMLGPVKQFPSWLCRGLTHALAITSLQWTHVPCAYFHCHMLTFFGRTPAMTIVTL